MQSVIELSLFTSQAEKLLSAEEVAEVIDLLASDPEAESIIPGTGGIRKQRVAASGRGKRGGARVIYYYHGPAIPLYALAVYAKNAKDDMTADEKRILVSIVQRIKQRISQ